MLAGTALLMLQTSCFIACSEEETEASEWDNWKARNEAYFVSLQDSLHQNPTQWKRIKNFSLNPDTEGSPTDYIYAKIIAEGTGDECPAYTDSVRIIYEGRLIPSATYPQGYVFDSTVKGTFSAATGSTFSTTVSSFVDGFSTALQYMHHGDYWRIYIPSELGYGDGGNGSSIPGNSVIIFDLMLIDFSHAGQAMAPWNSRQR